MAKRICCFCGKRAQGNYSVHRDGFCKGPEVPLCDACGKDESPTLEEIWKAIKDQRSNHPKV